jgi:CheY-like chemotaxis protein
MEVITIIDTMARHPPMATPLPQVLIIDDDPDQLQIISAALERNYKVLVAAGGLDGYNIVCAEHPAVVLLDLMMPTVDGWTVLRKLRANPQTKDSRVVLLTGMNQTAVSADAERLNVAAILQKPIDLRELKSALKRLVAQ